MSDRHRVRFEPSGFSEVVESGATVLDAAVKGDIPIRTDCGGKGLCGKCRAIVFPKENISSPTDIEIELLSRKEIDESYRLCCQTRVKGSITVTTPQIHADTEEVKGKIELDASFPVNPLVERLVLPDIPMPVPENGISPNLSDWIENRAREATGKKIRTQNLHALRQLSQPERIFGELTLVRHAQKGVSAVLSGRRKKSLGVAVDIGTTTVGVYLCDFHSGEILAADASANPQRRFGADVISRIAMANENSSGLETLKNLITHKINHLIGNCLEYAGATREDIDEVVIVGNSVMEQIFAGFHPHSLGVSPYLPTARTFPDFYAGDLGLEISPGTNVHLFPLISGFVGGDAVGVILAVQPHKSDKICLIVDIGTNGEVILGNRNGLWATSCATGPALEGAHISCGVRALTGAVSMVDIEPNTGVIDYQVIGKENTVPFGICGSGIIDAIAAMRRANWVLPSGRFNEDISNIITDEQGFGTKVVLVPNKATVGKEIAITLKDIRQVQLAKAALSIGIEFLMRKAGITRIDRTILTGAFGAKFNWKSAADIGMLPPKAVANEVSLTENLAGIGAILALLDKNRRTEAVELSRHIRILELAGEPDFAERFAFATSFPSL